MTDEQISAIKAALAWLACARRTVADLEQVLAAAGMDADDRAWLYVTGLQPPDTDPAARSVKISVIKAIRPAVRLMEEAGTPIRIAMFAPAARNAAAGTFEDAGAIVEWRAA